jgi:hypothetical protein
MSREKKWESFLHTKQRELLVSALMNENSYLGTYSIDLPPSTNILQVCPPSTWYMVLHQRLFININLTQQSQGAANLCAKATCPFANGRTTDPNYRQCYITTTAVTTFILAKKNATRTISQLNDPILPACVKDIALQTIEKLD